MEIRWRDWFSGTWQKKVRSDAGLKEKWTETSDLAVFSKHFCSCQHTKSSKMREYVSVGVNKDTNQSCRDVKVNPSLNVFCPSRIFFRIFFFLLQPHPPHTPPYANYKFTDLLTHSNPDYGESHDASHLSQGGSAAKSLARHCQLWWIGKYCLIIKPVITTQINTHILWYCERESMRKEAYFIPPPVDIIIPYISSLCAVLR